MTQRLDAAVAARGLARSRTHAAQLITAGLVSVDGHPVVKASVKVGDDQQIARAHHGIGAAIGEILARAFDANDGNVIDPPQFTFRQRLVLHIGWRAGLGNGETIIKFNEINDL